MEATILTLLPSVRPVPLAALLARPQRLAQHAQLVIHFQVVYASQIASQIVPHVQLRILAILAVLDTSKAHQRVAKPAQLTVRLARLLLFAQHVRLAIH